MNARPKTPGCRGTSAASRRSPRGFTLLELVLAIGLLALLVGMIFAVATQNIALSNAVISEENKVSEEAALFSLLDERLGTLPGNAQLELVSEDSGAQYLSDLTIQGVPLGFSWGGGEMVAQAVQLSTERRRDGFLDLVLRYYENEILEDTDAAGETSSPLGDEPFAEVVLMEDIYIFEWRVLDGRTMEWDYDWDVPGRLPLQMELIYKRDPYSDPLRHIFWITPIFNPELALQHLSQPQGGQGQSRTGAGNNPVTPGGGDSPVEVQIPNRGGGR